jgi:hypothetical protein
LSLCEAIGFDHAQRVLEAVEAGGLQQHGPLGIGAQADERFDPLGRRQGAILVGGGVDRRRDQVQRTLGRTSEGGRRESGRLIKGQRALNRTHRDDRHGKTDHGPLAAKIYGNTRSSMSAWRIAIC